MIVAAAACWAAYGAIPAAWAINRANEPPAQKPIFQWLFSVIMIALICAIAFKNPKRQHQS